MTTLFELPEPVEVAGKPKTGKQQQILDFIRHNGGTARKAEIVTKFQGHYFHRYAADNCIGAILSRMVKAGVLERVKQGTFRAKEVAE